MIHSGNGGKVRRIWRCSLERSGGLEVEWRLQGENEWDSLLCVMLESLFYQGQWVAKRSRGSSGISKDWAKEWSIKLCSAPESINAESEREEVFTASLAGIMRSSRGGLPFPHLSVPLPLLTSDISCRNGARINKWPPRLQCRHSLAASLLLWRGVWDQFAWVEFCFVSSGLFASRSQLEEKVTEPEACWETELNSVHGHDRLF